MSDTKLEPCPWAAGYGTHHLFVEYGPQGYRVECNCGVKGSSRMDREAAVEAWNQRAGWRTDWEALIEDQWVLVIGGAFQTPTWAEAELVYWFGRKPWSCPESQRPTHFMLITPPTEAGGKS